MRARGELWWGWRGRHRVGLTQDANWGLRGVGGCPPHPSPGGVDNGIAQAEERPQAAKVTIRARRLPQLRLRKARGCERRVRGGGCCGRRSEERR